VLLIVTVLGLWVIGYTQKRLPDVEFVPTPQEVVLEMLKMAKVTQNDVVYDLGCGDGRIVVTAAKVFGARGVGVDIDPIRIRESNENARKAGVTDRVKFIEGDLFATNLSEATVVTLYLTPELNIQVQPKLFRELKPGTRILSHDFDMGNWKPDNTGLIRNVPYHYPDLNYVRDARFYYWIIPANIEGTWRWSFPREAGEREYTMRLDQEFQEVSGLVSVGGQGANISAARLIGDQLSFMFKSEMDKQKVVIHFSGRVSGNTIKGNMTVQGGPFAGRHDWVARREH
jgi:SAM-dependent methyltransferase